MLLCSSLYCRVVHTSPYYNISVFWIILYLLTSVNVLYIFICLHVTNWHSFVSTWRPHFSISCKFGLVVVNFFSFCLLGKVFILLSVLKTTLVGKVFLVDSSFLSAFWICYPNLSWPVRSLLTNPQKDLQAFLCMKE